MTLACLRLWIQLVWQSFGASKRTTFQWTMTRCPGPWGTTTGWISLGRCKANDIATSEYFFWQVIIDLPKQIVEFCLFINILLKPWKLKIILYICCRFLRNPTELKNIKNISLLRQQMSPTNTKPPQNPIIPHITIKPEPAEIPELDNISSIRNADYDEKPTDLSMDGPKDLSSSSRHVSIVCSPDPPIAGCTQ